MPPSRVQTLAQAKQGSRDPFGAFELDTRRRGLAARDLDAGGHAPWLGLRPCTPDMRPVMGRAPRPRELWFLFGRNHLGLTLGPVSGRLLAETMTGATPFIDARPFRPKRSG